ncbi:MAG: tRNA adenosine(34) deaminase TadA [Microscillaceae bacterium]|nr:tRNA adenosine(34) deaminase TadA [Microscillaceae bacterium]MDW8460424.1 tRNA adenosine(34) deaminase TadA [Cytophagales bacterium]
MDLSYSDEYFMRKALEEARKAFYEQEIPVGAVLVAENRIIAKAYNQTERLIDVTAHAEILALTAGSHALQAKYLPQCTLYVTLEPCLMCAGAIYWSQIKKLVYGASDLARGFSRVGVQVLHPKTQVIAGILATECSELMTSFFKNLRQKI